MMNYSSLKYRLIILLSLFMAITSLKCRKDDSSSKAVPIVGTWQVTKLVLNGRDTLASLKSDSTCFPKLRFYYDPSNMQRVETLSAYNFPDSNFSCKQYGAWSFGTLGLMMIWDYPAHNTGPFLSLSVVEWSILYQSSDELRLHSTNTGDDCYLNLLKN